MDPYSPCAALSSRGGRGLQDELAERRGAVWVAERAAGLALITIRGARDSGHD